MKRMAVVLVFLVCAVLFSCPAPAKVGGGDKLYRPKGAAKVLFDHEYHVNQKGQHCNNCHFKPFQMASGAEYQMDMTKLTKGMFCGMCHDGKKSFDVKDTNSCKRCHKE